jgi:hypothetical protein
VLRQLQAQTRPAHNKKLAFGELEPLTGTLLAIFLTLVLPRIARQKASLLEHAAKLGVELNQSAGNTETNRTCLSDDTAAIGKYQHIEPFLHLDYAQRMLHRDTGGFGGEVVLKRSAIHGDLSRPRPQENTRDASLATPGSQILLNFS